MRNRAQKVLIVHEDAGTCRTMRNALTMHMILIVNEAASAGAALAICRHVMPDVIVVYGTDSRIDAGEFSKDIRHMNVEQPVILFVVAEETEGKSETVKAWGSGFILRPVTSASVERAFRDANLVS